MIVYKYEIQMGRTEVEMPAGAQILSAAFQGQTLQVWALFDAYAEKQPMETRILHVAGTGHGMSQISKKLEHIDTVFIDNLVFHVFEELVRGDRHDP